MPDDCPQAVSVGAYLLGALEMTEYRRFRRHLRRCRSCEHEVAVLTQVVDLLRRCGGPDGL